MNEYDYVVVGGGSAGSVIASRLSEDAGTDVLLLEAGRDWRSDEAPSEIRSPNFFMALEGLAEEFFWPDLEGQLTESKEPEHYFVGRGLGGGSTVNAQFYVRPPLTDFDRWAALGCEGWSGDDVLPYFKRAEHDVALGDRPYHGDDGPIPVWRPDEEEWGALDRAFFEAAREAGHRESKDLDFNAPDTTGLSTVPFNVEDGERVSTNDAYLEPARDRENLTILGDTLVDRVLFDGRTAVGVEALRSDGREVFLGDEVVLSAGAIYSPAILVRSGIGPADQLHDLGSSVLVDRPGLGRLIDHPLLSVTFDLREEYRASSPAPDAPYSATLLRWTSEGPYGRENDLNLHPQNFIGTTEDALSVGGLVFGLMAIYSRGQVTVGSLDPTDDPDVFVGMLSDRRDLIRVREAIRHTFDLVRSDPMQAIIDGEARFAPRGESGAPISAFEDGDDDALDRAILEQCAQYFHPVGTCRMGAADDPMAVVDPDCRVIGVDGLSVADASIMPDIVRANTNSTAIAIGERVADERRS